MKRLLFLLTVIAHGSIAQSNFSLDTVFHMGTWMEENIREIALCPNGDIVATGYPAPDLTMLQSIFGASNVFQFGPGPATTMTVRGGGAYTTLNQNTFVFRLSGDLRQLRWAVLIGGTDFDRGYGIEVDNAGDIYVAGQTSSTDFPVTSGALDETNNGSSDGPIDSYHGTSVDMFALKLSGDGQTLLYSTFLGGTGGDGCRGGLSLDDAGNIYLAGFTSTHYSNQWDIPGSILPEDDFLHDAINNPIKLDTLKSNQGIYSGGVVLKLSPTFDQVLWSRFLGSVITGMDVSGDNIYFAGINHGTLIPVTDGSTYNANGDVMVGVIDSDDGSIKAMSVMGGSMADDTKRRGVLDSNDNFYFGVQTEGNTFEGQNFANNAVYKAALVKTSFNSSLGQMQFEWVNVIDQWFETSLHGPVIDYQDNIYVSGLIYGQLPGAMLVGAIDNTYNAGEDAYMSVFDPSGTRLYTTYLGGDADDKPRFMMLDAFHNPILGINSTSDNFPDIDPTLQPSAGNAGNKDIHFTRILNNDCRIVSIKPVNTQSACDPMTNQYTQDLEVIFANEVGDLVINGQTYLGLNPRDTITVNLVANGQPVDITASFSGDASCNFAGTNVFNAPSGCTILPVEWLSFYGERREDDIYLIWETAEEENVDRFEIEKSIDGYEFIKIGEVNPAGNGGLNSYQFIDRGAQISSIYYRIKEVDFDGNADYTDIIRIEQPSIEVVTYPNPLKDKLNIQLGRKVTKLELVLMDISGSVFLKTNESFSNPQSIYTLNTEGLNNGIYLLSITIDGQSHLLKLKLD